MVDKKVMDYMKTKVESGFYIKDPSYFSMTCKNICGLTDKEQGAEVEKYLENITGFEQIAEDGVAIDLVGHKGDLRVVYEGKEYFPNAKSTMVGSANLWLKSDPNQMATKSIKVFDSSRTPNFSLLQKLKQIGNDLIIIHFAWHSIQLKGCVSITSLKEMAKYWNCKVTHLFNSNDAGHYTISTRDLYDTAYYHDRVLPFDVNEKEAIDFLEKNKNFVKPSIVELMN